MVRLSLAIALATALFGVSSAAPTGSTKAIVVSLPFSRATSAPNWKQAITADKNRASRFSGTSKNAELAVAATSVSAENVDFSYVTNVEVGTQTFSLIVDTGSSNTWVGAGTKYVPGSTATNTGDTVSVSYGSGSFSGKEYTDTVTLGTLVITKQSIGDATSATGFSGVDGIIGFGPTILTEGTVSSTTEVPTIIDNAYSEGLISTKVLGVYFAPISGSSTTSNNGELTLGGVDSSKYTGSITYTSITSTSPSSDYWGINISKIAYGTTSVSTSSLPGIVDTGTTLIYLQTSTYNALYKNISGYKLDSTTGLVVIPSSSYSSLQNVTFTIGGTAFTLTPAEYILPQDQVTNWGGTAGTYYSLIGDLGTESGLDFILGQKFLENFYSIFVSSFFSSLCSSTPFSL
ncbi:family A1 protease [Umbelopsis sp. PMI_123]|nr:family A1 protease [Umbelopsis sp. PMI_123]